MRVAGRLIALSLVFCGSIATAQAQDPAIAWAYPGSSEKMPFPELPATTSYHVEGSALSYTGQQINDADVIDWLPERHPAPPDIVLHGAKDREIAPCGGCHGVEGQGFLSVPNLAGLKASYIAQQLHEMAAGRRRSAVSDRPAVAYMDKLAGTLTEPEITAVAAYFSAIPRRSAFFRVVETASVPRTSTHAHGWQTALPGGDSEPLGRRVVIHAEDFDQMWAGDPLATAVAYVPTGAIERGRELVQHGAQRCTSCHGAASKGAGAAPALAGRNPQYLARQIWDIRTGARTGPAVSLMQKPAAALSADQLVDVVAYLASLAP